MTDYISREAAFNAILKLIPKVDDDGYCWVIRGDAATAIDNIPAADVRPAVRGHIEEDENTYLFCSECNCNITLATYETPNGNLILRPNFCPNCGADMREEQDGR